MSAVPASLGGGCTGTRALPGQPGHSALDLLSIQHCPLPGGSGRLLLSQLPCRRAMEYVGVTRKRAP